MKTYFNENEFINCGEGILVVSGYCESSEIVDTVDSVIMVSVKPNCICSVECLPRERIKIRLMDNEVNLYFTKKEIARAVFLFLVVNMRESQKENK